MDFSSLRYQMVKNQIEKRGVKDLQVLEAMRKVPRDLFVPSAEKDRAYEDGPLAIGFNQTISQPYIVAYMTEILLLKGSEKVLELGTGSGYQTAILAELAAEIYTIEVKEALLNRAQNLLVNELHYKNITFKCDNGRQGWPEFAPFDRIIVTAAPEEFPHSLFDQLTEGGLVVAPVGYYHQEIKRYYKQKNRIIDESLIAVSFVPLV